MWALYSSVSELPSLLRNSKNNIIVHCLWSGSLDINIVLEKYNQNTTSLFESEFEVDKYRPKLKVQMLGLLCDTVGRPKVCNSTQYNGAFGCLHCLHPNGSVSFTDGTKKSIYLYDSKVKLRTNADYLDQVRIATETKARCQGIKGR
jgi:hypothetical protein